MNSEFEDIQIKVKCVIDKLIDFDAFLLKENVNERSITHKLAEYLQQEFKDWNVDCEYNKMWKDVDIDKKTINLQDENFSIYDSDTPTVFPDIIIHKRENKNNLLAIEVKKSKNHTNRNKDEIKLKKFTSKQFNYSFGLNMILNVAEDFGKPSNLKWYQNEEVFHEEQY